VRELQLTPRLVRAQHHQVEDLFARLTPALGRC
jgi:hypothetical protein